MARNNETFGRVSTPSAGGLGAATTVFGGTIDTVAQQRLNQWQLGAQLWDPGEPGLLEQEPQDPNRIIITEDMIAKPAAPVTPEMARISALRHAAFRTGAELSLLSGLERARLESFGNPDLDDQEAMSRFRHHAALATRDAVDGMARTFGVPEDGLEMPTRAVLEDMVEGVASEGARARARGLEEKALDILEAGADDLLAQIRPGQPAAVRMAAVECIAAIAKVGDGSLIGVFPRDVQAFVNTLQQAEHQSDEERLAYADSKVEITSRPQVEEERVGDTKLQVPPTVPSVTIDERMESLGFDPSLDRGAVLPFAINPQGETEFAWPSILYEPAKTALMPGHLYQGGVATNEELLAASMDLTGVGMVEGLTAAPRGVLTSGAARLAPPINIDEAQERLTSALSGISLSQSGGDEVVSALIALRTGVSDEVTLAYLEGHRSVQLLAQSVPETKDLADILLTELRTGVSSTQETEQALVAKFAAAFDAIREPGQTKAGMAVCTLQQGENALAAGDEARAGKQGFDAFQ